MRLGAFEYLGSDQRRWDFNSFGVTLTNYPSEQRQPRHRHENPTYFFLVDGSFVDESDELGSRIPDRFELLFHPSGAWHESRASKSGRRGLNLEPSDAWLTKFDLRPTDLGSYRIDDDPVKTSDLLRLLAIDFDDANVEEQLLEIVLPTSKVAEPGPTWLRDLDSALRDNSRHRWSLGSLARELSVHPVYLARVFRARYGHSVTTYLLRKRLLQCAKEAVDGAAATEIALSYGFADHSHFARSFRAFFGVPPSAFRFRIGCKSSR